MSGTVYISDPVGEKYRSKADHAFIVENMHKTIINQLAKHDLVAEKHDVAHASPAKVNLAGYAGLILLGGYDIDPLFYTEGHGHQRYPLGHADVDSHQLDLIYEAYQRDIPVLGICRGLQLINVFFDGTLHYDIGHLAHVKHDNWGGATYGQRAAVHEVNVSGSLAIPTGTYRTASSHHQAVDRLGVDLLITGYSEDGIVEMIEHEHKNIVGVQWHPESSHVDQSDTITPLINQFATQANSERDALIERPILVPKPASKSKYLSSMVPEFEDEPEDTFDLAEEIPYLDDEEIPMWQVNERTGEITLATDDLWDNEPADYRDYDNWRHGNGSYVMRQPTLSSKPLPGVVISKKAPDLKPMF